MAKTTKQMTGFRTKCVLNKQQQAMFGKEVDATRFAYNEFVMLKTAELTATGKIDKKNCSAKKLRAQYPHLLGTSFEAINSTLHSVTDAFSRYFSKQNDFPVKKTAASKRSVKYRCDCRLEITNGRMYAYIPKIGKIKLLHDFATSPNRFDYTKAKSMILSQDKRGEYWLSFNTETQTDPLPMTGKSVGIDPGLATFATLSTGRKIHNPKFRDAKKDKFKEIRRKMAKCTYGSNRYRKYRKQLASLYAKQANQLDDFHKKTAKKITKQFDTIKIEDLKVKNLMARGKNKKKPRRLGRSFAQSGLGAFIATLERKAALVGKRVVMVPAKNTTKKCHNCGYINPNLTLADRIWTCPSCGSVHDRDVNAAINILNY